MRIIASILFNLIALSTSAQTVISYGEPLTINPEHKIYRASITQTGNYAPAAVMPSVNTIDSLIWNYDSQGVFALRCQTHDCFPFDRTFVTITGNNLWGYNPAWYTVGGDDEWVLFVKAYDRNGYAVNDVGFWIEVKVYPDND